MFGSEKTNSRNTNICFFVRQFRNSSNSDKYTEFSFWIDAWLKFLDLVEDQPIEILDKSSLWLHPILVPDESNLKCLSDWTTIDIDSLIDPPASDNKWNNILSPPQVNTGPPFDLHSMGTEEILSLTNDSILTKSKVKTAKLIDTPRGKTPLKPDNGKILSVNHQEILIRR